MHPISELLSTKENCLVKGNHAGSTVYHLMHWLCLCILKIQHLGGCLEANTALAHAVFSIHKCGSGLIDLLLTNLETFCTRIYGFFVGIILRSKYETF